MKKVLSLILMSLFVLVFVSCSDNSYKEADILDDTEYETDNQELGMLYLSLVFDNTVWNFDQKNNIYWQNGIVYCRVSEVAEYESLGIYVPGDYLTGINNGDDTYTCEINESSAVNGYTAQTAPIILPINTAGYSGQYAPTSYDYTGLEPYMEAGFIYVFAGCRGRDNGYDSSGNFIYNGGAPWGVTDLKAAVRYLRYNDEVIPGSAERIFTLGHSGGGAQSTLMGVTGDSERYFDYLESIGAIIYDGDTYISDAVYGSMAWCPMTGFDYADQAYEWMMGQYFNTDTRAEDAWTSAFSDELSKSYGQYIKELDLTDEIGNTLTLTNSETGIYTSGSYYDYLLSEIERSLNNFLNDTEFPYTPGRVSFKASAGLPGEGNPPEGSAASDSVQWSSSESGGWNSSDNETETFDTVKAYINNLNTDEVWVVYDEETNMAAITSIEAFVTHLKLPNNSVGAFDALERSTAENCLFGDFENNALHYNADMSRIIKENYENFAEYADWDETYVEEYQEYLTSVDALGKDSLYRQEMYNPMYYLLEYYDGYGSSKIAEHWRINSGIIQGNAPLTMEFNLALALAQYGSVDFEMVWAQGHTTAERKGDFTMNFIEWVISCTSIR